MVENPMVLAVCLGQGVAFEECGRFTVIMKRLVDTRHGVYVGRDDVKVVLNKDDGDPSSFSSESNP